MKLSDLRRVGELGRCRSEIVEFIDALTASSVMGSVCVNTVTLSITEQLNGEGAALRLLLRQQADSRLQSVDAELLALGVTSDGVS